MSNRALIDRITSELQRRTDEGLLRSLPGSDCAASIDVATNSYLALHNEPRVAQAARELTQGISAGNLSSRLIADRSPLYRSLEAELAAWKQTEAALVFTSGYAANLGILQAVASRDTEVFSDRLNHASLVDGITLARARLNRYHHCDMADLRTRLAGSKSRERLIVTDSVFSMDGDRAPLADICELAGEYDASVMIDEAHAAGVFGARQSGLVEAEGVEDAVDIRMGTLSKAIAGLGGFFAGSRLIRDYLVNTSRSLIYSTGLPHSVLAHDLAAVRHIRATPGLGAHLLATAQDFRGRVQALGLDTGASTTQIVPCIVGSPSKALALSRALERAGIAAPAIRPPTVPDGTARVRMSLHLGLTDEDLSTITGALAEWRGHA